MKAIPFVKYTSYGNNFVIIDETQTSILSEPQKRAFADQATDMCFGIGSDNLLVIQRFRPDALAQINAEHGYWESLPVEHDADFIFRMFEPDGTEAMCCGNGLMCIASYLSHQYGIKESRIMTEVPLAQPNVLELGASFDGQNCWANMGQPRRLPRELMPSTQVQPHPDFPIDRIDDLQIDFRSHDLSPFSEATSIVLGGHLVFTGEPHLVVLLDSDFSLPELTDAIFAWPGNAAKSLVEKRVNFGTWLIDHIGNYINRHYQDAFPAGVSINFVHYEQNSGDVRYRCFERGINRETLACGTGALAVAYVMRQLRLPALNSIIVRPHRCNWYQPDASIRVEEHAHGWTLNGSPLKLLEGKFVQQAAPSARVSAQGEPVACTFPALKAVS